MTDYLSEHFTLKEMTQSVTADKLGIDNTPGLQEIKNLKVLTNLVLEPARAKWGRPITITSGYRCLKLNRAVGGKPNSYHVKGMAADIRVTNEADARRLADILNEQELTDVVLLERMRGGGMWIHVQYSPYPRHHVNYNYNI